MLPLQHRLKKTSEFDRAYKQGCHLRGKFGKLVCFFRGDADPARFGIVIPAKVGKACVRNKAKRRIREFFRANLSNIPAGADITYIVWDAGFDMKTLRDDLEKLIKKIKT